mgnify:CR=1 FL=1
MSEYKKSADLGTETRKQQAELAADEYGSFSAFVRAKLDEEYHGERLEEDIQALEEELAQKRELLQQTEEDDQSEEAEEHEVPEGLEELYSDPDESAGDNQ